MFPLRAIPNLHAGEPSPAPASSPALGFTGPKAGEIVLTQGQKLALLVMRQSDLSKKVLAGVIEQTKQGPSGRDFYSCANLGLAINKGRFHVLTPAGRWRADRVAEEIAREFKLHIISYFHGDRGNGLAAQAKCTCGWRGMRRTLSIKSHALLISMDATTHLANVEKKKDMLIRLTHTNAETY